MGYVYGIWTIWRGSPLPTCHPYSGPSPHKSQRLGGKGSCPHSVIQIGKLRHTGTCLGVPAKWRWTLHLVPGHGRWGAGKYPLTGQSGAGRRPPPGAGSAQLPLGPAAAQAGDSGGRDLTVGQSLCLQQGKWGDNACAGAEVYS